MSILDGVILPEVPVYDVIRGLQLVGAGVGVDGLVPEVASVHGVVLDASVEGQDDVALEHQRPRLVPVPVVDAVVAVRHRVYHVDVRDLDHRRYQPYGRLRQGHPEMRVAYRLVLVVAVIFSSFVYVVL